MKALNPDGRSRAHRLPHAPMTATPRVMWVYALRSLLVLALTVLVASPAIALAGTASPGPKTPVIPTPPGELTPAEVVALGADADGASVIVRGEAVGDRLNGRDGGFWVNVAEEGTAIGLWGPGELSEPIEGFGDYHASGDVVEARGSYNAACDAHGGDRDVHIAELRVVSRGGPIERPLGLWQGAVGLIFLGVAAVLWSRQRYRMQRAY